MDVWRFKIDPEDDCCIMTTRGGKHVRPGRDCSC
jgi:hypothetical protein